MSEIWVKGRDRLLSVRGAEGGRRGREREDRDRKRERGEGGIEREK